MIKYLHFYKFLH